MVIRCFYKFSWYLAHWKYALHTFMSWNSYLYCHVSLQIVILVIMDTTAMRRVGIAWIYPDALLWVESVIRDVLMGTPEVCAKKVRLNWNILCWEKSWKRIKVKDLGTIYNYNHDILLCFCKRLFIMIKPQKCCVTLYFIVLQICARWKYYSLYRIDT